MEQTRWLDRFVGASITAAALLVAGAGCGDGPSASSNGGSSSGGSGGMQQTTSSGGSEGGTTASGGTGGATGGSTAGGGTGGATGGSTGGGNPAQDQAAWEDLCTLGACVDGVWSYSELNYGAAGDARWTRPNGGVVGGRTASA